MLPAQLAPIKPRQTMRAHMTVRSTEEAAWSRHAQPNLVIYQSPGYQIHRAIIS